jgi:hypothetical protein
MPKPFLGTISANTLEAKTVDIAFSLACHRIDLGTVTLVDRRRLCSASHFRRPT